MLRTHFRAVEAPFSSGQELTAGLGFARMREYGIPKVLNWRWLPCAALTGGALTFVGFALLVIPDRIGHVDAESATASLTLGNGFASTQMRTTPTWPSGNSNSNAASVVNTTPQAPMPPPGTFAQPALPNDFPRRGFSPPLEREDTPPPPPAPPPPPQPVAAPQPGIPAPVVDPPPTPTPAPDSLPAPPPPAEAPPPDQPAPPPTTDDSH